MFFHKQYFYLVEGSTIKGKVLWYVSQYIILLSAFPFLWITYCFIPFVSSQHEYLRAGIPTVNAGQAHPWDELIIHGNFLSLIVWPIWCRRHNIFNRTRCAPTIYLSAYFFPLFFFCHLCSVLYSLSSACLFLLCALSELCERLIFYLSLLTPVYCLLSTAFSPWNPHKITIHFNIPQNSIR